MRPPIIVFDLDGTLVDTAPDLLDAMNHALARAGIDTIEDDGFRRHVGKGARVMLERATEAAGRTIAPPELDTMMTDFLDHYQANMPGRSKPYESVVAAIEKFRAADFLVAVCTNKVESSAKRLLRALGIDGLFSAICGQDTFPVRKPDPGHLYGTIDVAGGDRRHALMVGDSETDILTARNAGIPVVAVDFGYTDRPVAEFAPDRVISHYDEMDLDLVRNLLPRTSATG
ncbi:HAD family hydrolase [Oricola thermophila]|uniref:Phosphoglycolate phosphatase n=1 Tax=Oricola thermophila TaxID=2742145 RepID=A0A6N1VAU5_9HYPH|nr:HAD family hydrolase [Oricola thermophila]QKV17653.1 phosphoglycolate phosphatase [Oricola thermophila]